MTFQSLFVLMKDLPSPTTPRRSDERVRVTVVSSGPRLLMLLWKVVKPSDIACRTRQAQDMGYGA